MDSERSLALRQAFLKGIGSVPPVPVSEKELDGLAARVADVDVEDVERYGYVIGHNWAIDKLRHLRRQLQSEAKRLAAEQEKARISRLYKEFLEIGEALRLNRGRCGTVDQQLLAVYAVCFRGRREEGLYQIFPGQSRDAIYQWKRRGLKRLRPHCSEELWAYLRRPGSRSV